MSSDFDMPTFQRLTDWLYQQGSEPTETKMYLNHLMQLSNWEDLIEFCPQESFKTSVILRQWRVPPACPKFLELYEHKRILKMPLN
jgi:hypothetical protein